jgi:hypothetical protein
VEWVLEVDHIPDHLQQADYWKLCEAYHNVFGRFDVVVRMTQEKMVGQIRNGLLYLNSARQIFHRPEIVAEFPEGCRRFLAKADWLEEKQADSHLLMSMASIFYIDGYNLQGPDEDDPRSYAGLSPYLRRNGDRGLDWMRVNFESVPGLLDATPPPAPAPAPRQRRATEFDADDVLVPGFVARPPPVAPPPPSLPHGRPLKAQFEIFWHKKKSGFFHEWDPDARKWVPKVDTLDYWTSAEVWEDSPDLAFVALFVIMRDCTSVDVERVFSKLRHLAGIYRGATLTKRLLHEALISMFPDPWREIHCGRPQE